MAPIIHNVSITNKDLDFEKNQLKILLKMIIGKITNLPNIVC